jgi:asparagine synthase (glutamine-hydrolysing)
MCGITGIISEKIETPERERIVSKMNACIAHRGPDHDAIYSHDQLTLGHRRLSIIDLSDESNQPFYSSDKRYVIVYNGELYNYKDLKLELQRAPHGTQQIPYFFKTSSDTEVVLAAYIRWGADCLRFFNGMFAFAVYDTVEKKLFVARDRLGVKPLYYYYGEEGFVFSSEIRAILRSGLKSFALNRAVLPEYLLYQTVHAPATIIKGIKMLEAGNYLVFSSGKLEALTYYEVNAISAHPELSYLQICARIREMLGTSVQQRLVSDVPFGAFLSGGIDSSAVVGLMSEVSSAKIQTFNISFDESDFSESVYARQIAKKFNTKHEEIKLKPQDFLKTLPDALSALDHPGGDGPNTYVVSKATRQAGIKMALSGIGGDELFAGYDIFKRMSELSKKAWLNAVPKFARSLGGSYIRNKKKSVGGNKISELLALPEIKFESAYPLSRSVFTRKELNAIINSDNPYSRVEDIISKIPQQADHLLSAVSLAEIQTYLQNVLLRDTDQMSMAVALEVREPFLDFRLLEFVLSLNDETKYPTTPKKLLVDSLGDLLPSEIVNRPKMGFTLPWQHWLRNDLKNFCEKNINEFASLGLCNEPAIRELWKRFLNDDPMITWSRVWHIVVLNNWLRENQVNVN